MLILLVSQLTAKQPKRPNVILIMVDDLGFSDISPYGASDIATPNIARLAREGVRLREFYNNAICAPTRASLLTGQYQHQAGVGFFNYNLGLPEYQGFLNRESLTLAEVLRKGGYSTLMSGKWHVGDDFDQWPNQRGFEHFFGFTGGASNYYELGNVDAPTVPLVLDNKPFYLKPESYLTDAITDHALDFIGAQKKEDKPFFLYLAFNAPHWPLQALPQDIARYKGKYAMGWDSLRLERGENARKLGVITDKQAITKHDGRVAAWNRLTFDEKEFWQRRQEVYAAMVDHVDQSIGRLLEYLKRVGAYDNTLILFISDNGAQGGEGTAIYTRRNTGPVGSAGSYDVQNSNWSQTGNSPLRSYKGAPYEGGISAPFIAWYPAAIEGGKIKQGTAHLIDLAPTIYDFAGVAYPQQLAGFKAKPLPGRSLKGVLRGNDDRVNRGEPLFWERGGNFAVRQDDWKLVSAVESGNKLELYDIASDRGENQDLAASHPDIVSRLKGLYDNWASKNGVIDYSRLRSAPASRNAAPRRAR